MEEQDINYQDLVEMFADALFQVQMADAEAAMQVTTKEEN